MKKTKSLSQLKKKALELFSLVKKKIAYDEGKLICFTCDKPLQYHSSDCQLGHFLSRGAYPGLTFEPDNSRIQCYRCNVALHGNITEFRIRLIGELGEQRVKELESNRHCQIKWSRSEFEEMIKNYNEFLKT